MSTNMETDNSWRGAPLNEIWGAESPWGAPEFPLVAPATDHTVLYHIPGTREPGNQPPEPKYGQEKWENDFVKMPFSSQSLHEVEGSLGEQVMKKRWETIESALSKPIRNSQELANAILSYNMHVKDIWKFRALHKLFNEYLEKEESQQFFDDTLPKMAKLALAVPKLIPSPIPVLKQNQNHSISLSQQQISSLLANAFFCTFPRLSQEDCSETSEFIFIPRFNFNTLYETSGGEHVLGKLKCLLNYFRRVCAEAPAGVLTFSRRSLPPDRCPDWSNSSASLAVPLHVDSANGIEEAEGLIQMDFANKRLGGGVLRRGCVQEEIRFVICPELLASMLFTETMLPHEAVMIIGSERYSKHSGYSSTFRWEGDHRDVTPSDACRRRRGAVLAVDATPYRSDKYAQYTLPAIHRELNKAWVGFSFFSKDQPTTTQYPGIATGNWGCGAYVGFPRLKTLIQLMACAEARRPMVYYTFHDEGIRDEFVGIYEELKKHDATVGQLYQLIARFCQTDVRENNLHQFIKHALNHGDITNH